MNKYEDNLIIELINKDKAINALIPIMCKHSIEPDIQNEIILCLLNIKEDIEEEVKSIFEKATQKAPSLYQDYYLEKEFWECPTCGSFLCENGEEYRRGEYCEDCGQRIDWRGEE